MREACPLRVKNEERWAFNDFNDFNGMCLHLLMGYSDVKPSLNEYFIFDRVVCRFHITSYVTKFRVFW